MKKIIYDQLEEIVTIISNYNWNC